MQAVVLAAGASSRFWPINTRHKALLTVGSRTLLEHTLHGLVEAGVTDIVVVEGPDGTVSAATTAPEDAAVRYVTQPAPDGMGDALQQARPELGERFVVTGPYRTCIQQLIEAMDGTGEAVVAGVETGTPERYGMLALDGDRATGIVEKPEPGEEPSAFKAVSTYILTEDFFTHLDAVEQHQYSFEDALNVYMGERDVALHRLDEPLPSLKYPWDALDVAQEVLGRLERSIAASADIHPSAAVEGAVVLEEDVTVYENAVIRGPVHIGAGSTIGNNAVVRSNTSIGPGSTVGANAEIRGSIIQQGFSCHSGFIGDSIIDRDVAIGAGTVIANRTVRTGDERDERPTITAHVKAKDEAVDTGRTRLGAVIGERVDIGTQANLMPGVCIGPGSFVGPSTLVMENVPADTRYYTKHNGVERGRTVPEGNERSNTGSEEGVDR